MSERFAAAEADLIWRANTGQVEADVEKLRREFRTTTQAMSDDTIRLTLAQDKLDKALLRHGPSSAQAKRAELDLRRAMDQTSTSSARLDSNIDRNSRSLDRFGRGTLAASGILGGLGRSVAFASSAFLGGAGLVYAIRSTISAATDAERIQAKLKVAVENSGNSWERNAASIDKAIKAHSRLSGIDDEELSDSLANLLRTTSDVNDALELNGLAADISRTKGQNLAGVAGLLARVYNGQYRGLKTLGLAFEPVTKAQDALRDSSVKATRAQEAAAKKADAIASRQAAIAALQQKFGRQAEEYGKTSAGAQDRFSVALENTQEIIGTALLPTITDLLNRGADYLNNLDDTGELQRKVNEYFEAGADAVHGIAGALEIVRDVATPAVKALGGVENTVKAITLLWVAFKVRSALGFAGTAAASALTSRKMVADAAVAGRAWDVATRPRVMSVTTTGGGAAGRLGGAGALLGSGPLAAFTALAIGGYYGLTTGQDKAISGGDYQRLLAAAQSGRLSSQQLERLLSTFGDDLTYTQRAALRTAVKNAARRRARSEARPLGRSPDAADAASRAEESRTRRSRRDGESTATPTRTLDDIRLDQARSEAQGGTGEQYIREEISVLQRQARVLERRKNLTSEQKAILRGLYGDIANAQSELDSIADERERAIDEKRRASAEKRAKEKAARDKRADDFIESVTSRNDRRLKKARDATDKALDRLLHEKVGDALKGDEGKGLGAKKRAADKGLTIEDFRRESFAFLGSLAGARNEFGSNIEMSGDGSGWASHSELTKQSRLMERQTRAVQGLASRVSHPEARYLGSVADALGDGPGAF